jgi:hypothetical protein
MNFLKRFLSSILILPALLLAPLPTIGVTTCAAVVMTVASAPASAQAPKVSVTTRSGSGTPLTFAQGDKNFLDLQHAVNASTRAWGNKEVTTTGLVYGYYGGTPFSGTWTVVADGTVGLAASSTNYVERSDAGIVTANATGWTIGLYPLAKVVTGSSAITTITDFRSAQTDYYVAPYTGAGARTQASKNAETISLTDAAGVYPGLSTDSTAGIQAVIDGVPAGSVINGLGLSYSVKQINVNKSVVLDGIKLVMLNAASTNSNQNLLYITANNVIVRNCSGTITPASVGNVKTGSCLLAYGVDNLLVDGGTWNGSIQDAGDYTANTLGSPIALKTCTNSNVRFATAKNGDGDGISFLTCTNCHGFRCTATTNLNYSNLAITDGSDNGFEYCYASGTVSGNSGLAISGPNSTITGNHAYAAGGHGINLGETGHLATGTICSGNTVSGAGSNTSGTYCSILSQHGTNVSILNNTILASSTSSTMCSGISFGNSPLTGTIRGNIIQTQHGHGILLQDGDAASNLVIENNIVDSSYYSGLAISGCKTAILKNNKITQSNRSNNANAWGIEVTKGDTLDPVWIQMIENTITDSTPYQRLAINVYSLAGTTMILTLKDNYARGWVTKAVMDTGGWTYIVSGNNLADTPRAGTASPGTSTTSLVVNDANVLACEAPIINAGNPNGAACVPYISSIATGTFTLTFTTSGAGAAIRWWLR